MNDRDRLEQLRGLLDRVERMPASADRDWMLREVRARAVDVETGVKPAALRALAQDEADAENATRASAVEAADTTACRKSKPTPATTARRATGRAAPHTARPRRAIPISRPALPAVRERVDEESAVDLLGHDGLLCLGDPPDDAAAANRPWCAGLRG